MKNIFQIIIFSIGLLLGQTSNKSKKLSNWLNKQVCPSKQRSGQGTSYTDNQINAAIQKEKSLESEKSKSVQEYEQNINLQILKNQMKIFRNKLCLKMWNSTLIKN